jgi:hypothetical protein
MHSQSEADSSINEILLMFKNYCPEKEKDKSSLLDFDDKSSRDMNINDFNDYLHKNRFHSAGIPQDTSPYLKTIQNTLNSSKEFKSNKMKSQKMSGENSFIRNRATVDNRNSNDIFNKLYQEVHSI